MHRKHYEPLALLVMTLAALVISGIGPYDRLTWWLEVFPILVAVPLLVFTYARFPLTSLSYRLIFVFALIIIVGGHYTYSRVPAGFWVQDLFELSRNHYDRFGHIAQGFVPAILAREILLRTSPLEPGKWLSFLVVCICAFISMSYEFIEWWVATAYGDESIAFLAMQGDPWDTHWDMLLAVLSAVAALLLLSRYHNRLLKEMGVL